MKSAGVPMRFLSSGCANIETILKPAGLDAAKDIITLASIKPLDPTAKDPELDAYVDFIKTRVPGVDPNYGSGEYAYFSAATLVELLKQCGDNLTRENILKQASNLKGREGAASAAGHHAQHDARRLHAAARRLSHAVQRREVRRHQRSDEGK